MEGQKPPRRLIVKANYFTFKPRNEIQKYLVDINPQLPVDKIRMVYRLLKNTKDLDQKVQPYIFLNYVLYSTIVIEDDLELTSTLENVEYKLRIRHIGALTLDDE